MNALIYSRGASLGECYLLGEYYPFACENTKTDNDR